MTRMRRLGLLLLARRVGGECGTMTWGSGTQVGASSALAWTFVDTGDIDGDSAEIKFKFRYSAT